MIIARAFGVHTAAPAELELLLGASLAAQHAVIATRAGLIRHLVVPAPVNRPFVRQAETI